MEVKTDSLHTIEEADIRPAPHYRPDGPAQTLTPDTARQAPMGRKGLIVLVASLLAVGIAWIVIAMVI